MILYFPASTHSHMPTCVFVTDDPCCNVCLDEAINFDAISEQHAIIWLSCDEECQAAVVTVCISGTDKFCCDDYFLSLCTAENWFQISNQYGDLVIYRVYLKMKASVFSNTFIHLVLA